MSVCECVCVCVCVCACMCVYITPGLSMKQNNDGEM